MKKRLKRTLSYLMTTVMLFTGLPMNTTYISASPEDNDANTENAVSAPWTDYAATEVQPNDDGVYEISTAEELAWLAKEVNLGYGSELVQSKYDWETDSYTYTTFRLTDDIDLSAHEWVPIGNTSNNRFKAVFDGAGYTITGMHVGTKEAPYTGGYYAGLFGVISGSVNDVKMIDPVVYCGLQENASETYAGLIAGEQYDSNSVISNCEVSGSAFTVGTTYNNKQYGAAGGITGKIESGTVDSCRAEVILGALDAHEHYCSLGGIAAVAGVNNTCTIKNCVADVTAQIPVEMNSSDDYKIDGIVATGNTNRCIVTNCISRIDCSGTPYALNEYFDFAGNRKNVGLIATNIASRQYAQVEPYNYLGCEAKDPLYLYFDGKATKTVKTEDEMKNDAFVDTLNTTAANIDGALTWTISNDENGGFPNLKGAGLHKFLLVNFVSVGEVVKTNRIISGRTVNEPEAPERDGYTFDYWYAEDKDTAYDFTIPVTDNLTLNAKWIPHVYSVRFDSKGGSYVYPQNVERDTKATVPTEPEKKGYSFGGWFTDSDCKNVWNFDTLITKDTVLYAGWNKASDLAVSGRVMDEDGKGIYGATVTLENGQNARTDEFGYYRLNGIEQGSYTITASAPGYNQASQAGFVVNDVSTGYDATLTKQTEGSQAGTVDIYTTVSCVYSGLMLEGVEVRAVGAGDLGTYTQTTDANGFVFFTGLPVGTYTFYINQKGRPGWESYVSDPQELTTSYNLRCALKPNYQKLSVKVLGSYDPVTEDANVPLKQTKVKLLGVDPKNEDKVLINREMTTDENGVLTVDNLVPITWKISASEFAYKETETTIYSNGAGRLSKNDVTLTLPFIDSSLTVSLESVYEDPDIFKASKDGKPATLKVELAGMAGTLSEGIVRDASLNEQGKAVFNKILPGTYQMTVSGAAKRYVSVTSGDGKEIWGQSYGKKYFEVDFDGHDTTNVGLGQNAEATITVTPSPVSFSGTLYKSDMNEDGTVTTTSLKNTKMTIKPSEYYKMNSDASEGIEITTDATGHYAASLWPGLYGVEVDGYSDNYTGGSITYYQGMTAEWSSKGGDDYYGYSLGWPTACKWTGNNASAQAWIRGYKGGGQDVGGMNLSSGTVVADLTLREKVVSFKFNKPFVNPAGLTYLVTGYDAKEEEGQYFFGGTYHSNNNFDYQNHWRYTYKTTDYHPECRGATVTVKDAVSKTIDMTDKSFPLVMNNLGPGNYTFTYALDPVNYSHLEATRTTKSFTFFDFPEAGKLPTNFPEDYYEKYNPEPLMSVHDDGVTINGKKGQRVLSDLYDGKKDNGEIRFKFYDLNEYYPTNPGTQYEPAKPAPTKDPNANNSSSGSGTNSLYYAVIGGDSDKWYGVPSSKWEEYIAQFDEGSDVHWRWKTGKLGDSIKEAMYDDSKMPTADQYYELENGYDANYRNYYSDYEYSTAESDKVEEKTHGYKLGSVVKKPSSLQYPDYSKYNFPEVYINGDYEKKNMTYWKHHKEKKEGHTGNAPEDYYEYDEFLNEKYANDYNAVQKQYDNDVNNFVDAVDEAIETFKNDYRDWYKNEYTDKGFPKDGCLYCCPKDNEETKYRAHWDEDFQSMEAFCTYNNTRTFLVGYTVDTQPGKFFYAYTNTALPEGNVKLYFCAPKGMGNIIWLNHLNYIRNQENYKDLFEDAMWFCVDVPESGLRNYTICFDTKAAASSATILSKADAENLLNPRTVKVQAVEKDHIDRIIDDAVVYITIGEQTFSSSNVSGYANQTCSSTVNNASVSGDVWDYDETSVTSFVDKSAKTETFYVPLIRKNYKCEMTVKDDAGNPVDGATVKFTGKGLGTLIDRKTDAQGKITVGSQSRILNYKTGEYTYYISNGLTVQDYDVEISAKGYGTQKKTIGASEFPGTITKEVTLTRQAQPEFIEDGTSMNRKGAFIPGVNFVGGSKNQVEFLTHTVLGKVTDNPLLMTLDAQIDTVSGDSLQEVFLVDKKSFDKRDYSDKPKAVKVPSTNGDEYNPSTVLAWIEKLRSGELGNVYYKRFSEEGGFTFKNRTKSGGSHYELSSFVPLWELPPDGFEPCLIAVTGNDAVQIYHFDYSGDKAKEQLVGMRMSGDKAKVLNNITLMANAQAAGGSMAEHLMDIISPTGSLLPLPQYEAGVTEEDGYLTYDYKLGIKLLQGKKDVSGADSAILSIAPTTLGIAIYGELGLTLNGEEREFSNSYNVTASAEDMDLMDYLPPIFEALPVKISFADGTPKGSFTLVDTDKFDKKNETEEKSYEFSANAQVKVNAEVSAFKALGAVPTVGQVLLALEKSGALDVGAKLQLSAGADGTYKYKIIKGSGETEHEVTFTVGIGAGIGLYAKAFGGSIGAEANLKVSGDNEKLEDMVTVTAEISKDGFKLKEVQGKLTADAHIAIETWFINGEKDFNFGAIPFKYEFNTETQFTLTPIKIKSTMRSRNDFDTSTFNGRPETVVSNFLPIGSYATDDTDNGDFLYTDMSAKGGDVRLMLAPYSGSSAWTTPVNIASTDGLIPAFDIIRLADGRELAVWTEIPKAHMEKSCPPSVIKYSVGTVTNGTWNGEVKTLDELSSEVASKLYLVSDSKGVSLVALRTAEGALAEKWSISGYKWNGTSGDGSVWGSEKVIAENQPLYDIAVTRADGKTYVSYVNDNMKLHVKSWGDTGDVTVSTFDVTGPETAIGSDGTNVYLVSEISRGGRGSGSSASGSETKSNALALRVFDGTWNNKGIIATAENPGNPAIEVGDDINISYTADGDQTLYVAECDKNGTITNKPEKVKAVTAGRFDNSSIFATDDEQVVLSVLKANSDKADGDSLIAHVTEIGSNAKIVKAPAEAEELVYDGKPHDLVSAGTAKKGTMKYAVTTDEGAPEDSAYTGSVPKAEAAGTYYVWYKVFGNNGFADSAAMSKTVTIAKRGITVTAKNQTITYGEQQIAQTEGDYEITATKPVAEGDVQDAVLAEGDTAEVTLSVDKTTNKILPTVTIKNGTADVTNNYDITQNAGVLTINKITLTVKANDKTRIYGRDNPEFTYEVTGFVGNDKPEDVLTGYLVCEADKTAAAGDKTYAITKGNLRVADSYADCYDIEFTAGTLTIRKASQGAPEKGAGYEINGTTITVDSESVHKIMSGDNVLINYGTNYELYEYDGSVYTKGDSFTISADKSYYVRWGESDNYSASAYTEINTTVGVAVMTLPAAMGKVSVEGAGADGTCKLGSSVTVRAEANEGHEFTGWQDADGKTVYDEAEYTFTVTKDTVLVATFKVKDKKIAVAPKTKDYTYDGTEKNGIVSEDENGAVAGEGYTLSGTLKATDAGTYIVTAKLAEGYDMWADGTTADKKMSWLINKASQKAPYVSVMNNTVNVTIPQGRTVRYSSDTTTDKADWTNADSTIADMKAGTYYFYTVGDKNNYDSPTTVVIVSRPTVSGLTVQPSKLTKDSVVLNGIVTPDGYINETYIESVKFRYRQKGIESWTTSEALTLGGTFSKEITGLKEDTDYEYQTVVVLKDASQTAEENTIYGKSISFHTLKSANTGSLEISVIDVNEVKRDVVVSIEAGNNVIGSLEPDNDGKVSFTNLPDGTYNAVVRSTDGDYTETRMVTVEGGSAIAVNYHVPAGKIATYVDVKNDDTPKEAVNGLNNIITAEDKDNAAAGKKEIEAKLEVEKVDENKAEGVDDIKELLDDDEKVDEYIDIELLKTTKELDADGNVTSIETKNIGSENTEVLEIAIPYEKIKTHNVKLIRYHNELAEFLNELAARPSVYVDGTYYLDKTNGIIYLYAGGFSTYAIMCVEKGGQTEPTGSPSSTDEPATTDKPANPSDNPSNPTDNPADPTDNPTNPTTAPTADPGAQATPSANQPTTAPGTATAAPAQTGDGTATTPGITGTEPSQATSAPELSKIKIKSVTCKKGAKKITVKLSVKGAKVKIKVGKKGYKIATAKGKTYTLKLGYKLKKKTKVIIQVSKKNYAGLKKTYKVK